MGMQSPNSKVSHHDENLISNSLHAIKEQWSFESLNALLLKQPEVFLGLGGDVQI